MKNDKSFIRSIAMEYGEKTREREREERSIVDDSRPGEAGSLLFVVGRSRKAGQTKYSFRSASIASWKIRSTISNNVKNEISNEYESYARFSVIKIFLRFVEIVIILLTIRFRRFACRIVWNRV